MSSKPRTAARRRAATHRRVATPPTHHARPRPAAPPLKPPRRLTGRQLGFAAFVGFGVLVLAIVYAEPIQDGDLFWHLAYAQQMVQDHTLVPDPTIYSWTPTSDGTIYCAWLGELFLYGVWKLTGLWGLFVLRYAVVAGVVAALWRYAWRLGLGRRMVTGLVVLLVALASMAGTLVKPELFSLLFFSLMVGAYFRARLAVREGRDARPWLVAVPVIMLVWVNTHGAFLLAAPFLVATAAGELLNARFNPGAALPGRVRNWLLGCWGACAAAVCITPYGPAYPIQLIGDYLFDRAPRPDEAWNTAHQSILDYGATGFRFLEYGVVALVLLGVAFGLLAVRRRGRVDWVLVLANLVYLPLFVFTLRTTYFWPAVLGYSVIECLALARERPVAERNPRPVSAGAQFVAGVAAVTFVVLGAQAAIGAYVAPHPGSWLGFGTGYTNPVVEADFVEREQLGPRLYNIFDSGGYLLWELSPENQVMVDSRSFPYLSWFDEQFDFAHGRSVPEFVERRPADVAVIDLEKVDTWRAFLALPVWRPVFYGPTAAVFVPDADAQLLDASDPLWDWKGDVRNASTALNAFDFATAVGDFPTAWRVLDELEGPLDHQRGDERRPAAFTYRQAYRALDDQHYDEAFTLLHAGLEHRRASDRDERVLGLLAAWEEARRAGQASEMTALQGQLAELVPPGA